MRIYITGGAAAGKKTLSRRLEAGAGIPAVNLNLIGDIEPDDAASVRRLAEIQRIVASPAWAAAGSHGTEYEAYARAADHVVLLETPRRIAARRIVSRHVKAELAGSNRYPGWRRLWQFFWRSRRYYLDKPHAWYSEEGDPRTRTATLEMLRPYAAKLTVCRSNAEVDAFITNVVATTAG
jgi:adenylate kinase family enzyme